MVAVTIVATLAMVTIGLRQRGSDAPQTLGGGRVQLLASFVVECEFTHRAPDDPIVAPGSVAGSHLHDFFGNFTVDTASTTESLLAAAARCDQTKDRSGYWVPTLMRDGRAVAPTGSRIYYRSGAKLADSVQPPPNGLKMVAGGTINPTAIRWGCSDTPDTRTATVRACGDGFIELSLRFPDCWDGVNLDSSDHRSHLSYASDGGCPPEHPEPIPAIRFVVTYPVRHPAGIAFSSGGIETAHGDVFVAWNEQMIATLVERCINRRAC